MSDKPIASLEAARAARATTEQSQYAFFDDRTALQLTQAFNIETRLPDLLEMIDRQLNALVGTQGLHYKVPSKRIELQIREEDRHKANYDLAFEDIDLGELTVFFNGRKSDHDIRTCEDLMSLAFTALRNCVSLIAYTESSLSSQQHSNEPTSSDSAQTSVAPEQKADALILVALDRFADIAQTHGEEWSHILMTSVHQQIHDGLRQADGVYHIGNDQIAVLLPNTTIAQSQEVAKKIRVLVASLHLRSDTNHQDLTDQLTVSMGISSAASANTAEDVMGHAKDALQQAQARGSNQICLFQAEEI